MLGCPTFAQLLAPPDAQGVLQRAAFARRPESPAHLWHDRPTIEDLMAPVDSGVGPYASTGTVAETIVKTVTLPSGLLKVGGLVQVTSQWSTTNNVNAKRFRVRMSSGGSVNNLMYDLSGASLRYMTMVKSAIIRDAATWIQAFSGLYDIGPSAATTIDSFACTIPGVITLDFTVQSDHTTDTMQLEMYAVRVWNPPP